MGHGVDQIGLVAAVRLGLGLFGGTDEAGDDCVGLLEELVEHLQARVDALGQSAPDDHVVTAHGIEYHAHVTDGSPLYGHTWKG